MIVIFGTHISKMITPPDASLFFSEFLFSGLLGGDKRAKNGPK